MTLKTEIYKQTAYGETLLGYIGTDQVIYKMSLDQGRPIGRVDEQGHVFRNLTHDERELGTFTADGTVRSHGLFEGGELGWVDEDGVVVQGGLILGEEEVGRVVGPHLAAAAAALLLLFLPEESEANKRQARDEKWR